MATPMKRSLQILLLTALLAAGAAYADTLSLPAAPVKGSPPTLLPHRGMSMAAVLKACGAPEVRHPTVGGHAPLHPPITRWDYPGYSVFFERSTVLDTVVPGHPPRLYHINQLENAH